MLVILTSSHGGNLEPPGVDERIEEETPAGCQFTRDRDLETAEIAAWARGSPRIQLPAKDTWRRTIGVHPLICKASAVALITNWKIAYGRPEPRQRNI
jgi:hypothetical protein